MSLDKINWIELSDYWNIPHNIGKIKIKYDNMTNDNKEL